MQRCIGLEAKYTRCKAEAVETPFCKPHRAAHDLSAKSGWVRDFHKLMEKIAKENRK